MNQLRLSIPDILAQALELPADKRPGFLAAVCEGDEHVRRRIERLLIAAPKAAEFLESPAAGYLPTLGTDSDQIIGSHIGPYKLLEQIGEGGMGVVYVAEQTEPVRRRVALKIIKPGMDTKQVIARFEAERQALAMMEHPNIARILDAGTVGQSTKHQASSTKQIRSTKSKAPNESGPSGSNIGSSDLEIVCDLELGHCDLTAGRPFLVMELVRGIPITEFCDQKQLSVPDRLKLVIDVCHAVQHAHQKGIIHRDLKPSNILVTLHDGTPVVKVIDFGVAKAMSPLPRPLGEGRGEGHTIYTAHLQLVGTPLYMSPEQAELSNLDVDTRADVYSLGVLLYELLTGTTPFDNERLKRVGFDEMRRIIREEEPETVSARIARTRQTGTRGSGCGTKGSTAEGCPSTPSPEPHPPRLRSSELDWITARALEKDRTRRFESPSALAADLTRYLSGDLVHACPPSALYRFRTFAKRNKAAFTTSLVVAASLLTGIAISTYEAIRATAAEAQASANEAKAKSEEQKAKSLAESEALQRRQAEKNLETAIEAVDHMLSNLGGVNVPQIGPLRRRMLNDAIAFYKRIPAHDHVPSGTRFRMAEIWFRAANACRSYGDYDLARETFPKAIELIERLSIDFPNEIEYQRTLVGFLTTTCWFYNDMGDQKAAFEAMGKAAEASAAMTRNHPNDRSITVGYADTLRNLSVVDADKDRASERLNFVAELLDRVAATEYERKSLNMSRAYIECELSHFPLGDTLFRRALAAEREHANSDQALPRDKRNFAHSLASVAGSSFWTRNPDEAVAMLDESIGLLREHFHKDYPNSRAYDLVRSLRLQVYVLRRVAQSATGKDDLNRVAGLVAKANAIAAELIDEQRKMIFRHALVADRDAFAKTLQDEATYILSNLANQAGTALAPGNTTDDVAARKLRADALLTEAIQLCRALAAEFPANADYKSRLAALEKLHAQHFGPKTEAQP